MKKELKRSKKAESVKKGIYVHYKGNFYEVLDIAFKEDDLEEYVIYKSLKEPSHIFLRKVNSFLEDVKTSKGIFKRFSFVDNMDLHKEELLR